MATRPIANTGAFPLSPSSHANRHNDDDDDDDDRHDPDGRIILHFDYDCFYASVVSLLGVTVYPLIVFQEHSSLSIGIFDS